MILITDSQRQYLDSQCRSCALGNTTLNPCPVRQAQVDFNKFLNHNVTAKKLMESLIDEDGDCLVKMCLEEKLDEDKVNFPENLLDQQKAELLHKIIDKASVGQIEDFLNSL